MDKIAIILGALGGASGLGTLLAFFIVPASKRHDEVQGRLNALDTRVQALEEKNSRLTAAVAVLVQHDEMLRQWIKRLDPTAVVSSAEEILAKVGMSLRLVFEPVDGQAPTFTPSPVASQPTPTPDPSTAGRASDRRE